MRLAQLLSLLSFSLLIADQPPRVTVPPGPPGLGSIIPIINPNIPNIRQGIPVFR